MRPLPSLWVLILVAVSASGAAGQEEPRVEVLFDGVLDARVPAALRVSGAERVRGVRGPWSLPVRAGSAEFVLPVPPLPGTALTIEREGRTVEVRPDWRMAPPSVGLVVDGAEGEEPVAPFVRASPSDLPTVATPYAMFDSLAVGRLSSDELHRAVHRARLGAAPGARALDPVLWEPDLAPFRAAVAEARASAALPPDVVALLLLLGGLQLALLGWARWRRPESPVAFVALALPGLVTLGWLATAGRIDGRVRARVACYSCDDVATVLLHVFATTETELRIRPPVGAGVPHPLRYDPDDVSWRDASIGHEVRLRLRAGESRLLAYRIFDESVEASASGAAPAIVVAWLRSHSLRPTGETFAVPQGWLPTVEGHPVVAAPGRRVEPGK